MNALQSTFVLTVVLGKDRIGSILSLFWLNDYGFFYNYGKKTRTYSVFLHIIRSGFKGMWPIWSHRVPTLKRDTFGLMF